MYILHITGIQTQHTDLYKMGIHITTVPSYIYIWYTHRIVYVHLYLAHLKKLQNCDYMNVCVCVFCTPAIVIIVIKRNGTNRKISFPFRNRTTERIVKNSSFSHSFTHFHFLIHFISFDVVLLFLTFYFYENYNLSITGIETRTFLNDLLCSRNQLIHAHTHTLTEAIA